MHIIMCKVYSDEPETDKGGHYDVEMKGWMEMGAI